MENLEKASQNWLERLEFLSESKKFLNKEFLTWLWYYIEQNPGPIQMAAPAFLTMTDASKPLTFYLWIDDKLVLESLQRSGQKSLQNTFKGGDPSHSPEASLALQTGKVVKELKLGLRILPFGDFGATLTGADLNPRTLSLPKPSEEFGDKGSDPLLFRIECARLFVSVLDYVAGLFLKERMNSDFEKSTLPKISLWMRTKGSSGARSATDALVH